MVQKENMNNPECILCGECIDVCPKKVIKYKFKLWIIYDNIDVIYKLFMNKLIREYSTIIGGK